MWSIKFAEPMWNQRFSCCRFHVDEPLDVPGGCVVRHAGHPHRLDGLGRWSSAGLVLFPTSRLVIEEESPDRLVLEPAP